MGTLSSCFVVRVNQEGVNRRKEREKKKKDACIYNYVFPVTDAGAVVSRAGEPSGGCAGATSAGHRKG